MPSDWSESDFFYSISPNLWKPVEPHLSSPPTRTWRFPLLFARLASSHYHCGSEAQTTWTSEQKNKAWEQSSVYDLHLSHNPSGTIFLLHKLALVGRASLEHRQTKFFILLGTSKLHICRHQPAPCEEELLNSGCTLLSSERNLYPDFTEYIPVGVKGHMSLSGWGEELSGMLLIIAASATLKQWSITSLFQLRVCWFINASTEEFC